MFLDYLNFVSIFEYTESKGNANAFIQYSNIREKQQRLFQSVAT